MLLKTFVLAHQALRVLPVLLVHLALLAHQVLQVLLVHQAPQVRLLHQAPLVHRVHHHHQAAVQVHHRHQAVPAGISGIWSGKHFHFQILNMTNSCFC